LLDAGGISAGPSEKNFMASSPTNTSTKTDGHLELGRRGEELAAAYLERAGYRIVAANFSLPVGRNRAGALINVEIDLVAYDGATLCFVEVKSRASDWFAPPEANVDRRKQRQIARAARAYRRMFDLEGAPYRYDVVTVVLPAAEERAANWEMQLLRNYWTEDKLRKRIWSGTYYD
jgi:putative endonuclease